jgi:two-component system response regulator
LEPELVRILLVEDNARDASPFPKALQDADLSFAVTERSTTGPRQWRFVQREGEYAGNPAPHLVVLDLNLPQHDGVEILKAGQQSRRFDGSPW